MMFVLSVSQLNLQVKHYLEQEIGLVHVEGELSNLSRPYSGHVYFTLKDEKAQIRCVFFKNRHVNTSAASLQNGQQIIACGRLSLYEARGDYQLIVEEFTESGLGALYQQFEALKNKLALEGLFLPARKKALPSMPQTIGIITSMTGAAIQDMLATLLKRFPLAKILIYPSEVQGASAASQLIRALQAAQRDLLCEVLILARGGGSLEDLWPFNDELLARQIAACSIPIVSGIGHETDFTIADFVADYRAETPTAAATRVSPNYLDLIAGLDARFSRLQNAMKKIMHQHLAKLNHLRDKIASPKQSVGSFWQKLNYLEQQLLVHLTTGINQKKHRLQLGLTQLQAQSPKVLLQQQQIRLGQTLKQLQQQIQTKMTLCHTQLKAQLTTLQAVSPLATLDRGYAIASKEHKVLTDMDQVSLGDLIEVRLAKGRLSCTVQQKTGIHAHDN